MMGRYLPGRGNVLESRVYDRTRTMMPGSAGWDFYEFRKQYKRLAVQLLENLNYEDSSLRKALLLDDISIDDALKADHRSWEAGLWKDYQTSTHEDDSEVVEENLMHPCEYCRSKKVYEFNTTDYAQQIRSADEPMTVFVKCHTCGRIEKT